MKKLVFATGNAHKLSEVSAMLGGEVELRSLKDINCFVDIPETADTLEENALMKMRYIKGHYDSDCFADDTGLEVEALNGAPGVHTARYAYADRNDPDANNDKLLRELKGSDNRKARFRTVIALWYNKKEYLFEGIVEGTIVEVLRGTEGFGYDPIFAPIETGKTFSEMGVDQKNIISHRARAIQKLNEFLKSQK